MKRNSYVLIICLSLWTGHLISQSPVYQPYLLPKKLETLEFNKILQDHTGYMWFGTAKGLFRFDGISYKSFYDSLPNESVTALAEDSVGRIWAGSKNGSIVFLENNEIKRFQPEEGLPTMQISDMLFDRTGTLWFSTYGDGIYYYENNRLYRLDETDGMPDLFAYDLEEDPLGNIWVGTDGGAVICTRNEKELQISVVNYVNDLPDAIVKKIAKGKASKMVLATEEAGILYFDPTTNTPTAVLKDQWTLGSISDFLILNNWIWVATQQGLAIIDLSKKIATVEMQLEERVTTLEADNEGGVWVGTKTNLYRFAGDRLQVIQPQGSQVILAVTAGADGDIWYSTSDGLFRRETRNGKVVDTHPLTHTRWSDKKVISLFTDSEGSIWAGFFDEGVIRIDPNTLSVLDLSHELSNRNVINISGRNKTVWLATLGGATEIRIDDNYTVQNYSQAQGLATDYLYQVFVDGQNRVWFATDRDGVDMLDEKGFHHYKENLNFKVIYGLAEDSLHRIWANVQNDGLYLFDGNDFQPFQDKERLHSTNFDGLISGTQNHLLVSHKSGLDIFDPKKKKFYYVFNEGTNALKSPNLNAIARNNDGQIFIGTNHGLVIYDHYQDHLQDDPIAWIEEVEANGHYIDIKNEVLLPHDQNLIKIAFTGFWYQNTEALTFLYQLENFDDQWFSTDSRSVTYSRLPPGEYVFKLKISGSNDFSGSPEKIIRFTIQPPFWMTYWFFGLSAVLLSFSVFMTLRYRERKLKNYNRVLEIKVQQRTAEIRRKGNEIVRQAMEIRQMNENLESMVRDRTHELEQKNKALEDYAFLNAHKLRAPVARVLGLIHLMKALEVKESDKIFLEHLQSSSLELDLVVRSMTRVLEQSYFKSEEAA